MSGSPRVCPLCQSRDFKVLTRKDTLDGIYDVIKCKRCGLVFVDPMPSLEDLKRYYNEEYDALPYHQEMTLREKLKRVLDVFKGLDIKEGGKVLEIGASRGSLLNELRNLGMEVHGVEISRRACEDARKYFGINIENADILNSKYKAFKSFFDAVIMLDVLEHLVNQNQVLSVVNEVLKIGGYLILTLPNIDSWEFKLFKKYWEWLAPPAHLFYYSPKTLNLMLKKHGFKILYLETCRGDSSGNLLFQAFLAFKQMIFYHLKYILGEDNLRKQRKRWRERRRERILSTVQAFSGVNALALKLTDLMWKPIKFIDDFRFKRGAGPTILAVAVKREEADS